ncbi:MAG: thioesterase family protein [Vicinamibacterales bacterium]|nr:thioesterase family protein [Vicinamibacterales bacterium]MDP6608706.1 thioesterase family protein [Vicinamibacterales bacterium]
MNDSAGERASGTPYNSRAARERVNLAPSWPMPPTFHHSITVRFRDCDELGHVNNAVYFTYLEEARWAFFRHIQERLLAHGWNQGADVPTQPGTILAHAECDYRSEAKYGDVLEVGVTVASVGRSSFGYEYEVVDAVTGRLVANAKSVQVSYDAAAKRSIPIPDALRATLEECLADPAAQESR